MAQMVERCVRDAEVACSNHVTPIKEVNPIRWVHLFSFVVIIRTRSLKSNKLPFGRRGAHEVRWTSVLRRPERSVEA